MGDLKKIKLFNTGIRPIGVIFLLLHVCIRCIICGIFSSKLICDKLCILRTSYVVPRATHFVTQSKLFSLQYLLAVSLILPILITLVFSIFIFIILIFRRTIEESLNKA